MLPKPSTALRSGHARVDISPGPACSLLGYDQRLEYFPGGGHGGVHDPLFADVLVVEGGDQRAAVVSLDLCILETPCANALREIVGAAAGIPAAHVILACSHTHSGPYPWRSEWSTLEEVPHPLLDEASRQYADFLEERLAECAAEAAAGFFPTMVDLRTSRLGMGYTRRVPLGDGTVKMAWDLREWSGPEPGVCGDDVFQVLVLRRADAPDVVLWNSAAHAVVLGKRSNVVSADWPGAVRARFEKEHPGARAMFFHSAGGDVHPWLATGENVEDLAAVAAPPAEMLLSMMATCGPEQGGPVRCASSLHLTALRMGPARILAVPCEIFGITGATLRKDFPDLLLATTANGWQGYWPPAASFPEGGHEVAAAIEMGRQAGDCERLIEEARQLLFSL